MGAGREKERAQKQTETIDHKVPKVGRNKVQTLGLPPFQLLVPSNSLFCLRKLEWVPFVFVGLSYLLHHARVHLQLFYHVCLRPKHNK